MTQTIKKETRETFIPNKFFFSISLKESIGGKLVVIAKNLEEAQDLINFELKVRGK